MRKVSKEELEAFIKKYDVNNLKTLNKEGKEVAISELERNALECITKTDMIHKVGDEYEIDEKMHAMYFAIHHFMETGSHIDAFNLYCVYSGAFLNDENDQLQHMYLCLDWHYTIRRKAIEMPLTKFILVHRQKRKDIQNLLIYGV